MVSENMYYSQTCVNSTDCSSFRWSFPGFWQFQYTHVLVSSELKTQWDSEYLWGSLCVPMGTLATLAFLHSQFKLLISLMKPMETHGLSLSFLLLPLQSGNSLQVLMWWNCRAYLICFPFSEITALSFLMFYIFKTFISHVLPRTIDVSDGKASPVPITLSWPEK